MGSHHLRFLTTRDGARNDVLTALIMYLTANARCAPMRSAVRGMPLAARATRSADRHCRCRLGLPTAEVEKERLPVADPALLFYIRRM